MFSSMEPCIIRPLGGARPSPAPAPMAGTSVCAGFPSPADDFLEGSIDLAELLTPNRAASFLWRVSGHSMRDAGIHDGDIVVVDRSRRPRHGDAVVAIVDGEVSLKVFRERGPSRLSFGNAAMPEFVLPESVSVEVWGTVTWTLHRPALP